MPVAGLHVQVTMLGVAWGIDDTMTCLHCRRMACLLIVLH